MKINKRERFLSWHLTSECPESCGYGFCQHNVPNLRESDYAKILQQIIDSGIEWVSISGGEPLMNPYCIDIIKTLHNHGINVQLNTAAIPLTPEIFEEIKDCVKVITLPFESLDDDLNEKIRGNRDHRQIIDDTISMVKNQSNMYLKVNTCVHAKNINHILELGEHLNNLQIDEWQLRQFFPVQSTAKENKREYEISDEDYYNITTEVAHNFPQINLSTRTSEKFIKMYLMVEPNGDLIRASEVDGDFQNIVLGNLVNETLDLTSIYEQQEIITRVEESYKEIK